MNTGKFTNAYVHVTNKPFDIADAYVAPTSGTPIGDWEAFRGTVTFPYDIFRNDETVEKGDVQVVYVNDNREIAYNLDANQWAVEGNKLTFVLPVEPAIGDMILFYIAEGAIADVYGNVNNEYSSAEIELEYVGFIATKDMVLGSFDYLATVKGETYNLGTFSIVENPEAENGLILKDFYLEGSQVPATMDLATNKIFVEHLAYIGDEDDVEEDGTKTTYSIYTYDTSGNKNAPVNINSDGTLTSDALALVGTPNGSDLYFWVNASETVFQRPVAAARGAKAKKHTSKKGKKLNVKLSNLRK